MPESTGTTNISQADDNEPFNEYNGDDQNQGNYPIVNKDNIWAFISFKYYIITYIHKCTILL